MQTLRAEATEFQISHTKKVRIQTMSLQYSKISIISRLLIIVKASVFEIVDYL